MSEKPILFSGAMVRAILSGQKTQTRRAVKKLANVPPEDFRDACEWMQRHGKGSVLKRGPCDGVQWRLPCPYGEPGDRLWVRETWAPLGDQLTEVIGRPRVFRADADLVRDDSGDRVGWWLGETFLEGSERPFRWRSSLHMPRWASRITLDVVSVRVERLQAISEADAEAEGVSADLESRTLARDAFRELWDTINGKRPGCSWGDNPWVWVVDFERSSPKREAA